jgi:hypothetical protein
LKHLIFAFRKLILLFILLSILLLTVSVAIFVLPPPKIMASVTSAFGQPKPSPLGRRGRGRKIRKKIVFF